MIKPVGSGYQHVKEIPHIMDVKLEPVRIMEIV